MGKQGSGPHGAWTLSTGRKERWALEDYLNVARLIGEGVPLNEALGKERPAKTAYWKKMQESPELQRAHALAMTMRAETRIERIEGLVDKLETGKIDPSSAATAIKALQWLAQKESPKIYSDIQRSEVSGPEGKDLFPEKAKVMISSWHGTSVGCYTRANAPRSTVATLWHWSPPMTLRNDLILSAAVSRVVSAFTAVLHAADGEADLSVFQRSLNDKKLGLTPDQKNALKMAGDQRLVAEIWAEVTRRRGEGAFPYSLRPKRRQALN